MDYNKSLRKLEVSLLKDTILMMRRLAKLLSIWIILLSVLGAATVVLAQDATITITPPSGPIESNFSIDVTGLQASTTYTVDFIYALSEQPVFTTERTTDRTGRMLLPITSTPDDEPGAYLVQVSLAGNVVVEGSFELTAAGAAPAPQQQQPPTSQQQQPPASSSNVTVRIVPASAPLGATYDILVAGLSPSQSVTIAVLDPDGDEIYQRQRSADNGGGIDVRIFSERGDVPGTYTVEVRDNSSTVLGSATFIIEEPVGRNGVVSISPSAGPAGTTHEISLSQVRPFADLDVLIFVQGETTPIFNTRVRADVDGRAVVSFTSEEGSANGSYRVVIREGLIDVAEGTLSIGAGISPAASDVVINVDPQGAALGDSFNVSISGLSPNSIFTFEIVLDASGEVVYSVSRNADAEGRFETILATDPSDPLGAYTVRVVQNGANIASAGFNIGDSGSAVTINVSPTLVEAGSAIIITATGLEAGETVTIEIRDENNLIFTRENQVDVNGTIALSYNPDANANAGAYDVRILRGTEALAQTAYTIEAALIEGIAIEISPESGVAGTVHTIRVTGLEAGENLTVEVYYAGELDFSTQRTANINGVLSLELIASPTDPEGDYEVRIVRRGEIVAQSILRVGEADIVQPPAQTPDAPDTADVAVDVVPPAGPIGTNHEIRISGLSANETVDVDVRVGGASVFSTQATADADGNALLTIFSEAGDPPGDYEINVIRNGQTIGDAVLTIQGEGEQIPPASTDVVISITPDSGPIGTSHIVDVSGLEASETVTIEVSLNGRAVFATEREADINGAVQLMIASEQGDMPGVYTVSVLRAGQPIASAALGIAADIIETEETDESPEAAPSDVSVSITPDAGPPDTRYDIVVEGLTSGEVVTLELLYEGRSVYNAQRSADQQGRIDLTLRSEPTDPMGDYTFNVLRAGAIVASDVLVISSGDVVDAPSVAVSPEAGPIGTSHAVSVSGLNPGETVTLQVLFDGNLEYSTDRSADAEGNLSINLRTDEGDSLGLYTINILRGSQTIAQGELIVGDGAAVAPPASSTAAGDGEMFSGTLSAESPNERISFSGEAGEIVYISLTSGEFDTYLLLLDADGNTLSLNDDDGLSRNAAIGPFMLPYSGDYEIVSSSYGYAMFDETESGAYDLRLSRGMPTALQLDQSLAASFNEDADMRFFTFMAETGDIISLSVDSDSSIDTVLSIADPDNFVVAFDDDGGSGFDPEINRFVVTQAGEYTVLLRAFTPGEIGDASMILTREVARSVDSESQRIRLNNKQLTDAVRMTGSSGSNVELTLSVVAGSPQDLLITVLQDETTLMSYTAYGIPQEIRVPFLMQSDGPVSIVITDSGNNNSVLDVSVQGLP